MATTHKYLQGKQKSTTNLFKIITGNINLWYIEVDDVALCISLATLRTLSKYKQWIWSIRRIPKTTVLFWAQ